MATMTLESIIPSSLSRPPSQNMKVPVYKIILRLLSVSLSFTSTLLIGACVQGVLLLLVPRVWVLLPAVLILLSRTAKTLAITFSLIPNPEMNGVVTHPVTAVIPNARGDFNEECHGSHEKICIQILSLRPNHPLGFFAPSLGQIANYGRTIIAALDRGAPDNGFLGLTSHFAQTATGTTELLWISYWRHVDHVLDFAYGPEHRETWAWWNAHAGDLKHVGIGHELYQADRSAYENVFINFQPTRVGATSFLRKGDETVGGVVSDEWVSPLVDARRAQLRWSKARLGRTDGAAAGGATDETLTKHVY